MILIYKVIFKKNFVGQSNTLILFHISSNWSSVIGYQNNHWNNIKFLNLIWVDFVILLRKFLSKGSGLGKSSFVIQIRNAHWIRRFNSRPLRGSWNSMDETEKSNHGIPPQRKCRLSNFGLRFQCWRYISISDLFQSKEMERGRSKWKIWTSLLRWYPIRNIWIHLDSVRLNSF